MTSNSALEGLQRGLNTLQWVSGGFGASEGPLRFHHFLVVSAGYQAFSGGFDGLQGELPEIQRGSMGFQECFWGSQGVLERFQSISRCFSAIHGHSWSSRGHHERLKKVYRALEMFEVISKYFSGTPAYGGFRGFQTVQDVSEGFIRQSGNFKTLTWGFGKASEEFHSVSKRSIGFLGYFMGLHGSLRSKGESS